MSQLINTPSNQDFAGLDNFDKLGNLVCMLLCLKECRNLNWFEFINSIFGRHCVIYSAWCTHHNVHYVLQFSTFLEDKRPKTSFPDPDPKVKAFLIIWWFYWIQLMILGKMSLCLRKLELQEFPYFLPNSYFVASETMRDYYL